MINEATLQWLWRYKKIGPIFSTYSNQIIEVVHPGDFNTNAGPDFLNARIKCNNIYLAGSVEFHVKSSDWILHKHNKDKAYDNVILHVVWEHDAPDSVKILGVDTVELKNQTDAEIFKKIDAFLFNDETLPCASKINSIPKFVMQNWLERMVIEKFENKVSFFDAEFLDSKSNWNQLLYKSWLMYLGAPLNSEPFKELASLLPFHVLKRHANNPKQLAALLYGVSGFLTNSKYTVKNRIELEAEYNFLKSKYNLNEITYAWKFSKTRPSNFPTQRIEQFLSIIQIGLNFDELISAFSIKEIQNKYCFGQDNRNGVSSDLINKVCINSLIPIMMFYGRKQNEPQIEKKAYSWLEQIRAEKNSIVDKFKEVVLTNKTAYETQALNHLYKNYCLSKQCLNCTIGIYCLKN